MYSIHAFLMLHHHYRWRFMNGFCCGIFQWNHRTCFNFALEGPQEFHFVWQFWCCWIETWPNGRKWMGKLKSCMHIPRAKLKHVLWSGDLKDSLKNSVAITLHLIIMLFFMNDDAVYIFVANYIFFRMTKQNHSPEIRVFC